MAVLSGAMATGVLVGCAVGWAVSGPFGAVASLAAAGCCWGGGLAAIAADQGLISRGRLRAAMLAGAGLRLVPPIALAVAARLQAAGLWEAGLAYYLAVFYIVVLSTETITRLPLRLETPQGFVAAVSGGRRHG